MCVDDGIPSSNLSANHTRKNVSGKKLIFWGQIVKVNPKFCLKTGCCPNVFANDDFSLKVATFLVLFIDVTI